MRKKGLHYLPEGKALINRIASQMNNYRLSTTDVPRIDRFSLKAETDRLLSGPSNYASKDGKVWIHSLERFKIDNQPKGVQLVEVLKGDILNTFLTQTVACAYPSD